MFYRKCPKPILRTNRKPRQKLNHATPGYIYVFYDRSANLCKIGLSRQPETRKYFLSREYESDLEVVAFAYCFNMLWGEQTLHKTFSSKRQYRSSYFDGYTEWFAMSSTLERLELKLALYLTAFFVNGCYFLGVFLVAAFALMLIF